MPNNQYVNKVEKSDGTTIIDITDTTAEASDVASGKEFYLASGAKATGTSVPVQSDWAENDSTDPSYVQNRTHYRTSAGYIAPIDLMSLIEGVGEYYPETITIDGNDYTYNYWSDYRIYLDYQYANCFPTDSLADIDTEEATTTLVVNGVSQTVNFWYDSETNHCAYYNSDYFIYIWEDGGLCVSYASANNNALTSLQIDIPITNEIFVYSKLDSAYLDGRLIESGSGFMSEIFNGTDGKEAHGDFSHAEGCGVINAHLIQMTLAGEAGATTYTISNLSFDPLNMSAKEEFMVDEAIGKNIYFLPLYSADEKLSAKVAAFDFESAEYTITLTETLDSEYAISGRRYGIGIPTLCAAGFGSHAEGEDTFAIGEAAHAEGSYTTASGDISHAEGSYTTASENASHAEGSYTTASGWASHAEGSYTTASGYSSHAEGHYTTARGEYSHAEGGGSDRFRLYLTGAANATTYTVNNFSGGGAHPKILIGKKINGTEITNVTYTDNTPQTITLESTLSTTTINNKSYYTSFFYPEASANYSHAEGRGSVANGNSSHAEGCEAIAGAQASHAEGIGTIASSANQHVQGKYNIEDTNNTYADIVGNGTTSARSNAYTLDWSGNGVYAGKVTVGAGPTNNMDVATKQYVDNAIPTVPDALGDLTDTAISSPSNGQILKYNSTTSKWVNGDESAQNGALSISSNVITLTNASGTTSSINLPIYNGGVQTV